MIATAAIVCLTGVSASAEGMWDAWTVQAKARGKAATDAVAAAQDNHGQTGREAGLGPRRQRNGNQHHRRVPPPHIRCDKNGDGVLSREEWPFSAELFTKLDKNANGVIDADERPGKRGKFGKGGAGKGQGRRGPAAGGNVNQ
jgi:hypothetical protein